MDGRVQTFLPVLLYPYPAQGVGMLRRESAII